MIADLFPLLTLAAGRSGPVSGRARRRKPGAVIASYTRRHFPSIQVVTDTPCPCQCWKKADYIYQGFSTSTKLLWRRATKKPCLSGYDLWMKSAVYNFTHKMNAPDAPPVSGGYTQIGNNPGDTWHVPPVDVKPWEPELDPDYGGPYKKGHPCQWCVPEDNWPLYREVKYAGITGKYSWLNGHHYLTQPDSAPWCRNQLRIDANLWGVSPQGPDYVWIHFSYSGLELPWARLTLVDWSATKDCMETWNGVYFAGSGELLHQFDATCIVKPATHGDC